MYFEILVEDASGKIMLESIVPRIIGEQGSPHRYRIINIQELKHRVMSHMPRRLSRSLPWDEILFQTLTIQLRAYGRSLPHKNGVVIVVVDLDYHHQDTFQRELESLFERCHPKPPGSVCLAVEEGEAWLLGDREALYRAYPFIRDHKRYLLDAYEQDSVCGTWEVLADALYRGGAEKLEEAGYPLIGKEKCRWAENVSQYMKPEHNISSSFQHFKKTLEFYLEHF